MNALNDTSPKVSVVMAAYNAADFIAEAINSILSQTYTNFELIIVNDGSTDNTDIALSSLISDKRIIYIAQKNAGQTIAKNNGIKAATGEVIGFCDADDYWHPEKLRIQMGILQSDPKIGVVYSDIQAINHKGEIIPPSQAFSGKEGNILTDLVFDNFIPFGSVILRKECLKEHGLFNESYRMGIDWDLWLRISTSWQFKYTTERLYFYRQWDGQMSRNYNGRYNGALTIIQNFYSSYPLLISHKTYRKAISDIYANYAYHISLYEGYNFHLIKCCAKALFLGFDRLQTIKRVIRAIFRRF